MAERDANLAERSSNTEATEVALEDEADSLLGDSNCSRRDSNDLITGDERRQSEDSMSKDISNFDSRTDSIGDHYLEESPNVEGDQDDRDKQEDDHEDILDVQAGVDATIDDHDQFEVLDSAGDTDNVEHLEEVKKSTSEDDKRRSKTKHVVDREERSHDKKEPREREPREKESDSKGLY